MDIIRVPTLHLRDVLLPFTNVILIVNLQDGFHTSVSRECDKQTHLTENDPFCALEEVWFLRL